MTAVTLCPPTGDDRIARVVLDRPDDKVNALNMDMLDGLAEAIQAARAERPDGLIVESAKPAQWVAGADLKLVTQPGATRGEIEAASRRLQAVVDELAWVPFTTVAAINGAALGGGLELALACDYRVASDVSSVLLGQPEVSLGLLPAGGGTQRLPRLVGLERALDLILRSRRLNARRARSAGLLDEVVHPAVLTQAARAWARQPKRSLDRPLRTPADLAEQTPLGRQFMYRQARHAILERTHGLYPAPLKALQAIQTGLEQGVAAGLDAEAHAFGELAVSDTAKNLIWLFLETQRTRHRDVRLTVDQLGVVGAGFMGAAIAEVGAAAGFPVRVRDVSSEAIARGLTKLRHAQRVSGTTDYSGFHRADVVIEAVSEDLTLKRRVVAELEDVVRSDAVIASNTSAIPIRDIAEQARHPERIVGMHFFSPAERMPLLEVVKPANASDAALSAAVALGAKLGKTPIVVADAPGFYTTRVLGVMLNEAALMLAEGARLEDVDQAMTAFGFPVGPFVLYDEVGLEVAQHAGETVARAFGDRIPAATIVADLVGYGHTGRKVGRGFYLWPSPATFSKRWMRKLWPAKRVPNPVVYGSVARQHIPAGVIQDRLALLFVSEAIRCLEEGVIQSPTDGDLGAVLGLGFPPFRGGPFHHVDSIGREVLARKLEDLERAHGPRFAPPHTVRQPGRFYEEQP